MTGQHEDHEGGGGEALQQIPLLQLFSEADTGALVHLQRVARLIPDLRDTVPENAHGGWRAALRLKTLSFPC